MVIKLSGFDTRPGKIGRKINLDDDRFLESNRLVKALIANDQILSLIRNDNSGSQFDTIIPQLRSRILDSQIVSDHKKLKNASIKDDTTLWLVLIKTIVARDSSLLNIASSSDEFTHRGFDKAFDMIEETLKGFTDNHSAVIDARNALDKSFSKAYELYHMLLWLPVELTDLQNRRLDSAKHKFLPSADDLNPDMKFVNNKFVEALRNCNEIATYQKENPLNWIDDDEVLLRHLLDLILQSEIYAEYMSESAHSMEQDCEFWRKVFKRIILPSDELAETLENRSIYWNDDIDIMGTFVLKTIKKFSTGSKSSRLLMPQYKDSIDSKFGPQLFNDAVTNYEQYRGYIERFIAADWEIERVAFMDIVILVVAIAELIGFPEIPVAVTVNEYIEIANTYSTRKSGTFINGILHSIITLLNNEGKISK